MAKIWVCLALCCLASLVKSDDNCHKIVTSNAGLTSSIPMTNERGSVLAKRYANSDADVVCAQEFWHEEDMAKAVKDFPYHYSRIHDTLNRLADPYAWYKFWTKRGACRLWETGFIATNLPVCSFMNGCLAIQDQKRQAECVMSNCVHVLKRVTEDCISCIFMNAASSLQDSLKRCHAVRTGFRFNAPGLLLLSKKEIVWAHYQRYFPNNLMNFQRGYIEAEIKDIGKVVCTHLSSNIGGYFEYDLPFFSSYKEQQRAEILLVNATFHGEDYIFAGDMNTGPAVVSNNEEKNLTGEYESNYHLLVETLGFESPYMEEDGRCTFCQDNPLALEYPNVAIDHVLLMGDKYEAKSAKRVLDSSSPMPLSDHYGVEVEVCQEDD